MTIKKIVFGFYLLFISLFASAQNETTKWYFGYQAGLDFMTNPPTILTNGAMNVTEGCLVWRMRLEISCSIPTDLRYIILPTKLWRMVLVYLETTHQLNQV
jgi:hypothetical protein